MQASSKLVFFGTEDFSLPSLVALVEAGYDIVAVVTKPDAARGRSKQLVSPAVKTYAVEHNLYVLQPHKLSEVADELRTLGADAAILVSYGKLLPQSILDVFEPIGIVNIHPSLLPRYRGPAPLEAAIRNGDSKTGVTLMKLTLGMDEGPTYVQESYDLQGDETKPELYSTLSEHGAALLVEHLPAILSGQLKPLPQKNDDVSVTSLLLKSDGVIDPTTDTAGAIERQVRAYLGYPKTRVTIGNNDVIVTRSKVVDSLSAYPLTLTCKENSYLAITELVAPSGKTMTGEAYVRGLKKD